MKKLVLLASITMFIFSNAYGSGFQLNEQGARAMSMAGAFAGLANDPSAIYFNPAGIAQLRGTNFQFGATLIMPLASYQAPGKAETVYEQVGQTFTPVNFYITQEITDGLVVGLSFNNQYGLGTKWDPSWPGRYLAVNTDLKTYFGTAVVAYQVTDNLSISAGAMFAQTDVTIERKSPFPAPLPGDFSVSFKGDGNTFGFTGGILYKPTEQLSIGASYRSEMSFDLTGTATSTPAGFVHPLLQAFVPFPTGGITAPLTTPQNATLGIAYMPNNKVTLTADFQYVGWSSYDKLQITFDTYDLDLNPANGRQNVLSVVRDYQNSYIARAGMEYNISDAFAFRCGALYDHNPVKDAYVEPTLPDADRIGLNIGYGAKIGDHINLDVAYMLLIFTNRSVNNSVFGFNGQYSTTAHLFGVDLSYRL